MKTFKEFQEAAFAIPAATSFISKFALPAAATIIGGLGTYMQARKANKARKPYEKRTGFKSKETSSKESKEDMLKRVREAQARIQTQADIEQKLKKTNQPSIKPKKGEIIQDEFSAPTNNVGDGQIAGTVEAGDDPPVKKRKKKGKKKRYIYGGRGSRKMWMS